MKLVSGSSHTVAMAVVALPSLAVTIIAFGSGQDDEARLYWGVFVGALLTWGTTLILPLLTKEDFMHFLLDAHLLAMPKSRPLSWECLARRLVLVMLACTSAAVTSLLRADLRPYATLWLTTSGCLLVVSALLSLLGSRSIGGRTPHA